VARFNSAAETSPEDANIRTVGDEDMAGMDDDDACGDDRPPLRD